LAGLEVDPMTVDPKLILAQIMVDTSAPAAARVSAAKTLLLAADRERGDGGEAGQDDLSRRAIKLMRRAAAN
jgi:hypothetical protein